MPSNGSTQTTFRVWGKVNWLVPASTSNFFTLNMSDTTALGASSTILIGINGGTGGSPSSQEVTFSEIITNHAGSGFGFYITADGTVTSALQILSLDLTIEKTYQ